MSKVQYLNYEPGEFVEEKERTKQEVIELAESLPWEKQREHIQIDITCPSITIQNGSLSYLKLALYYNGRFVLYFFDGESLYTKSLSGYKEAFATFDYYFEKQSVNLAEFKKENLLFKHVVQHFVSKDFTYIVNKKRVVDFLLESSVVGLAFSIAVLIITVFNISYIPVPFFIFIFLALFGALGINILLVNNYYPYVKKRMLKIAKGQDIFWFGDIGNMVQYNKKDVYKVAFSFPYRHSSGRPRTAFNRFAIYTIYFNNAQHITFNSLLIGTDEMGNKFTIDLREEINRTIPFMHDDDL